MPSRVFAGAKATEPIAICITAKADWGGVPLDAVVVEVSSDRGYNWIPVT